VRNVMTLFVLATLLPSLLASDDRLAWIFPRHLLRYIQSRSFQKAPHSIILGQQRFHLAPQCIIPSTGLIQKRLTLDRIAVARAVIKFLNPL